MRFKRQYVHCDTICSCHQPSSLTVFHILSVTNLTYCMWHIYLLKTSYYLQNPMTLPTFHKPSLFVLKNPLYVVLPTQSQTGILIKISKWDLTRAKFRPFWYKFLNIFRLLLYFRISIYCFFHEPNLALSFRTHLWFTKKLINYKISSGVKKMFC